MWLVLGSFLCNIRVFFYGQGTELGYFWGLLKFQIFFGMLDIPDFFLW